VVAIGALINSNLRSKFQSSLTLLSDTLCIYVAQRPLFGYYGVTGEYEGVVFMIGDSMANQSEVISKNVPAHKGLIWHAKRLIHSLNWLSPTA